MKKILFTTLLSIVLACSNYQAHAMNWFGRKTEPLNDDAQRQLEIAQKAHEDNRLQQQMQNNPQLNLILWMITNIENTMQNQYKAIEQKFSKAEERISTLEASVNNLNQLSGALNQLNNTTKNNDEKSQAIMQQLREFRESTLAPFQERLTALENLTINDRLKAVEALPAQFIEVEQKFDATIAKNLAKIQEMHDTQTHTIQTMHNNLEKKVNKKINKFTIENGDLAKAVQSSIRRSNNVSKDEFNNQLLETMKQDTFKNAFIETITHHVVEHVKKQFEEQHKTMLQEQFEEKLQKIKKEFEYKIQAQDTVIKQLQQQNSTTRLAFGRTVGILPPSTAIASPVQNNKDEAQNVVD